MALTGVNVTVTVHDPPTANVAAQSLELEYPAPVVVMTGVDNASVPVLVTNTDKGLVSGVATLPKVKALVLKENVEVPTTLALRPSVIGDVLTPLCPTDNVAVCEPTALGLTCTVIAKSTYSPTPGASE
jgi:hypothetical protein